MNRVVKAFLHNGLQGGSAARDSQGVLAGGRERSLVFSITLFISRRKEIEQAKGDKW